MSTLKPVLTEYELGPLGWRTLLDLANQRGRTPRNQAVQLVRYALSQAISGADVEPTLAQIKSLYGADVAA